ncbi:hypothetical protein [Bacillus thuringiensis]|uniref:hypothetical protein n=1 Tax=Bacillus thuringiensis TaxID=1428 RepID=UPI0021D66055|nr:hypothetical protein [Bacillus thuringiensis]MCU7667116.1 hypothetical protein [Bacillus thuringiensis]
MKKEGYMLKQWNEKWREFLEEQKLALLVETNDVIVDNLSTSMFKEKVSIKEELIFDVKGKELVVRRSEVMKTWRIISLPLDWWEIVDGIEKAFSSFDFSLLSYQADYFDKKEFEVGMKFKQWDVEEVRIQEQKEYLGLQIVNENSESILVYSEKNREKEISDINFKGELKLVAKFEGFYIYEKIKN